MDTSTMDDPGRLLPAHGRAVGYTEHLAQHGPLPSLNSDELVALLACSGLTGRGGAAFPAVRKLQAVLDQHRTPVVVANAAEGEPASRKDGALLRSSPHVVLDGLILLARATFAHRAVLYVHHDRELIASVSAAIDERASATSDDVPIELIAVEGRFIAGEESAVISGIESGQPIPRHKPPSVFEQGVHGAPTLVHNAETVSQIGLIARYGVEWFRSLGTQTEPGTMLFSVSGAVARPAVVEAPLGVILDDLWAAAGGISEPIQAVLFGGYHGAWLPSTRANNLVMSNESLRPLGVGLGAGVVLALPSSVCPLLESARVLDYLSDQSAGQCGPCLHGLPRLAKAMNAIANPRWYRRKPSDVDALFATLSGRNACHHPDGSVRFAARTLAVFDLEVRRHRGGDCSATSRRTVLPT